MVSISNVTLSWNGLTYIFWTTLNKYLSPWQCSCYKLNLWFCWKQSVVYFGVYSWQQWLDFTEYEWWWKRDGSLRIKETSWQWFLGIIHLVPTQNSPKNFYFLPLDTHTYVCVSGGWKCRFFGHFAYVLNEWSFTASETQFCELEKDISKHLFALQMP